MRWTAALGLVSLLAAPAAHAGSSADVPHAASASDRAIAIESLGRVLDRGGLRSASDLRSEELGDLDRGPARASAHRAAGGGVTVIARGSPADPDSYDFPQVGFVWTRSAGMMLLGGWEPLELAPDGSTIIGVWPDAAPGPRLALASERASAGANALSLDGKTLVGWGASLIDTASWRPPALHLDATHAAPDERGPGDLAAIPEPATAALIALGLAACPGRRRSV
jgi:hypothetical protein